MYFDGIIKGKYVDLKSATIEDAEFTRNIRKKEKYKNCFPKLENTLEQQKKWIISQQKKEGDYFFVVWDKAGHRIGTIGASDFNMKTCEPGRLIIEGNAFQCIEAQILLFEFIFDELKMEKTISYIYADNTRAMRFNLQFGGSFEEPKMYSNYERPMRKIINTREQFVMASEKLKRMIYRE